ncbi:hypothetical protein CR513_01929, partial [Mucuna pruriens]
MKIVEAEQQMEATMVHAERSVQEAQDEARFLKDGYIKLAWLANQAIMDIPRGLHIVEGMVNPLSTPVEITHINTYHNASNKTPWDSRKGKQSTSQHRYATHSKSKAMENKVEALKQQNQDLKGEEQMTQMFQLLSQTNAAITAMAGQGAIGYAQPSYAQPSYATAPPPHNTKDPPYGMPYS